VNRPAYYDEFDALDKQGELDEIIRRCKEFHDEFSRCSDDAYPETAYILESLGRAYSANGDWCADALETEKALRIHRTHATVPNPHVVRCLSNLGCAYLLSGRLADAEETLAEALMLCDHLPERGQYSRGFVLINLAHLETKCGDLKRAEQLLLQAASPLAHHIWWCNLHLANVYCWLAEIYEEQGRPSAADRCMEKAVKFGRWSTDVPNVQLACLVSRRGLLLKNRGRIDEARAAQTDALAILERVRKPGHYLVERVKYRLARVTDA
jgi:tetratricopeptide (TPR) repeat protein